MHKKINMQKSNFNRRKFLEYATATATGVSLFSAISKEAVASAKLETSNKEGISRLNPAEPRIKFSVIGINHDHIYSQVDAVIRGGGALFSLYAIEPDLIAKF